MRKLSGAFLYFRAAFLCMCACARVERIPPGTTQTVLLVVVVIIGGICQEAFAATREQSGLRYGRTHAVLSCETEESYPSKSNI